jgi:fatty-acyl-CoA synthase
VFEKGDLWFRTGDLMRKDANAYFYFVDRIGDTFRWKGENVSTTEVEHAICQFEGVLEANVYGVEVPGRDGRAGMAAIVTEDHFNLTAFHEHLAKQLPEYARPVFLRIRQDVDVTTTFKQRKVGLVKLGFNPETTDDPIFVNDPAADAFERLDGALYGRIIAGDLRL